MSLEPVAQMLSGPSATSPLANPAAKCSLFNLSDRQKTARFGILTALGGILLASLISTFGVALHSLDRSAGEFFITLSGIGGLIFMVGLGLFIYSRFLPRHRPAPQPQQQNWLPPEQPSIDMRPGFERRPVRSVTENTTELLDSK